MPTLSHFLGDMRPGRLAEPDVAREVYAGDSKWTHPTETKRFDLKILNDFLESEQVYDATDRPFYEVRWQERWAHPGARNDRGRHRRQWTYGSGDHGQAYVAPLLDE